MNRNQQQMPLMEQLISFAKKEPLSFHVPGHKNGAVFPDDIKAYFESILPLDVTELTGLDDLHAPQGVISEAAQLAADFFGAEHTFFLVGGSTVGNLAMILAACAPGDKIIVQRNCHKSVMNGLELSGANPIFISPEYDPSVQRYTAPSYSTVEQAITEHPDAKALVLTYPDYFGQTYPIKEMIELAHHHQIPVLVDEAHGVHFALGEPFPTSALALGADIVVQSAHKMAPALTMASYLHIKSNFLSKELVGHYLQMLQSSSPSYLVMASLDSARAYLATRTENDRENILTSAHQVKRMFQHGEHWEVVTSNDPLKITLQMKDGLSGFAVADAFEAHGIYPELATDRQVLFIHGLKGFEKSEKLQKTIKSLNEQLKKQPNHATIDTSDLFTETIQQLAVTYQQMHRLRTKTVLIEHAKDQVAAEAIIPYPPGIPVILKGERITEEQIRLIQHLIQQGATFQHHAIEQGIQVFER
ncbi:aminotransferase class I/II-fold pyridoxal phosphate-dependent enzyme [Ornithinibacillus contaminans]|uniref:aminotransferase class I/II-fold pyridoxal phosphate-dependent enzyme n=1 Tax=Ornithinibacillus contaminans TaxID=694055 RepID=UPI00064DC60A|nr:aminotransferase class I/II-fold pyridoxal phosphate-dependent enzyme [Ornithinibacillus contaminans]